MQCNHRRFESRVRTDCWQGWRGRAVGTEAYHSAKQNAPTWYLQEVAIAVPASGCTSWGEVGCRIRASENRSYLLGSYRRARMRGHMASMAEFSTMIEGGRTQGKISWVILRIQGWFHRLDWKPSRPGLNSDTKERW